MSLRDELDGYRNESRSKAPPETVQLMLRGVDEVKSTGIESKALRLGDLAPDFNLPNVDGRNVKLSELLGRGPVVVIFYRGAWCPYCNLQLRAYQRALPRLRAAGAALVAISPQLPDGSLSAQEKNELAFPVLSDVGSHVATSFNVAYRVPADIQKMTLERGNDLGARNGTADWMLPVPATFVIAPGSRIVLAHVDADYTTRMEPDEVLDALEKLVKA